MTKIVKIEKYTSSDAVYDPVCEEPHAYISNGVVSHNCVLWVDEIEKSLSGTGSSNFSDGGTIARVFGTLLTAMEEQFHNVVVVATANDISMLPPELIRRFDEVFFVGLPTTIEREEILRIHMRKRGREKVSFNLKEILEATNGFTGSEIEKIVREGIARAWQNKKKEVDAEDLLASAHATRPISVVMSEKIAELKQWAKDRARFASTQSQSETEASTSPTTKLTTASKARRLLD